MRRQTKVSLSIFLTRLTFYYLLVSVSTFIFAVLAGIILDRLGFEKEVKRVSIKGGQEKNASCLCFMYLFCCHGNRLSI